MKEIGAMEYPCPAKRRYILHAQQLDAVLLQVVLLCACLLRDGDRAHWNQLMMYYCHRYQYLRRRCSTLPRQVL